ncbi:LysR family transcriptional regulator [Massilia sp. Root418]|jgi:DNA-binding transcriptional LysR family regulator|uniref:LysR family transcriptional regulator n=1 Tax=Massilia sp. Root418 TaxID=1736532 RepID=UPI0006FF8BF3|nr:LysR family transcriptional regulator [Massilia sp. Root418]KQX00183.1 LysR family transcriptional regulator [Massilia sp. Root418]
MDFNGVDLNLLAAFNALMQERNVTRAAARVNVSQPAMSAALARLRTLLGDRLFQRSTGGLLPTPRAYEVAEPIARALLQIETVFAPAAQFAPHSAALTFTVGVSEYPAFVLLPQLLGALAQEAPGVRVEVQAFTGRDEAVALLDAGKVDVAIGVAPTVQESRILSRELLRDRFVTLVASGQRRAHKKMDLDAYLALGHVLVSPEGNRHGLVDQVLAERGLKRDVRLTLPHMFAVPAILRQTGYTATLLRRVALHSAQAGELLMLPPPVPLPDIAFHMIWHRRNDSQAAQRWLRDLMVRTSGQFAREP